MEPLTTPSTVSNQSPVQSPNDPTLTSRPARRTSRTPWGLFIGLLLILAIVVAGAYYTLNERLAPQSVSAQTML